jgi:hypothetical protein
MPINTNLLACVTNFQNNCGLHIVAHQLIHQLDAIPPNLLKSLYENFLRYYHLAEENLTLDKMKRLLQSISNPVRLEVIIGPVLRNVLQAILRSRGFKEGDALYNSTEKGAFLGPEHIFYLALQLNMSLESYEERNYERDSFREARARMMEEMGFSDENLLLGTLKILSQSNNTHWEYEYPGIEEDLAAHNIYYNLINRKLPRGFQYGGEHVESLIHWVRRAVQSSPEACELDTVLNQYESHFKNKGPSLNLGTTDSDVENNTAALSEAGTTVASVDKGISLHADGPSGYTHRVFISHRGTQKKEVAFPIMAIFSYFCGPNFAVFDEITLETGEENRTVLSKALSQSAHCLALISDDFFQSKWTVAEVDSFLEARKRGGAHSQRKIISFFIGLSPADCRSLDKNKCDDKKGALLSAEVIQDRQRIAKILSRLNGREQAEERVLGKEPLRDFILKHMPDLIENELRDRHPALLPEFNYVHPALLAYVYDEAVAYYEKANGKVNIMNLRKLIQELKARASAPPTHSSIAWKMIAGVTMMFGIFVKLIMQKKDDLELKTPFVLSYDVLPRLQTSLRTEYEQYVHLERLFDDRKIPIIDSFINLALIKEAEYKQKEKGLDRSANLEKKMKVKKYLLMSEWQAMRNFMQ